MAVTTAIANWIKRERRFREWYAKQIERLKQRGVRLNPNPDDPRHFYDYRAAFDAGSGPDESGHWPSKFKMEGNERLVIDGVDTRTNKPVDQAFIQRQKEIRERVYREMDAKERPEGVMGDLVNDSVKKVAQSVTGVFK